MYDLVIGALQDVVERRKGFMPAGKPVRKGDRMLGTAIDESKVRAGKASANLSTPVPDGMAAVMATIFSSSAPSCTSVSRKTECIARCIRLHLGLRAGDDVELVDAVILVGSLFAGA